MTTNLYFTSIEPAGKTALGISIGLDLINRGKKVGYFIPFHRSVTKDPEGYMDATFSKEALHLTEPVEQIAPIHLTPLDLWKSLTEDTVQFTEWIKNSYNKLSKNKDVVIIEGLSGFSVDSISTLACYRIADSLDSRVIVMLRYSKTMDPSMLSKMKDQLNTRLTGVIINYVPESCNPSTKQNLIQIFQKEGIKVLGFIPEVHRLLGITVGELARSIDAIIVTGNDNQNKLIEHLMIGAMSPDSGKDYFNRMDNKAVIINSERADMQLAALETSTSCLILTGDHKPLPAVLHQSEDKKIPIIATEDSPQQVIDTIEQAFLNSSFNNADKMRIFTNSVGKYIDFPALFAATNIQV
jgi:uncharacterized protein